MNRTGNWVGSAIFLALIALPAGAATRVALVSAGGGEAVQNVLALAEARLSGEKDIELLDRTTIGRILDEQKLSLDGLVNAQQAVAIGKLLAVDLFAVVENDGGKKQALGLVIFQTRTGARLWDTALRGDGPEATAAEVADGLRVALDKQRRLFATRTVCLMTVRNADLPREYDGFGESVGLVLERELTRSPDLIVLERERLEQVNRERILPTAAPLRELLGALYVVDLEIGRSATGQSFRVTAVLTDSAGKEFARPSVSVLTPSVAATVPALETEVLQALKAAPRTGATYPAAEARRFANETAFLWAHGDFLRALRTAEAAYALEPARLGYQTALAKALLGAAIQLIHPGGHRSWGDYPRKAADSEIQQSLAWAERGSAYLLEARPRIRAADRDEQNEANAHLFDASGYLTRYLENILGYYQPSASGHGGLFEGKGWSQPCLPLQVYIEQGRSPDIDEAIQSCHAAWRTRETDRALESILANYRRYQLGDRPAVSLPSPQDVKLRETIARLQKNHRQMPLAELRQQIRAVRLQEQKLVADAEPPLTEPARFDRYYTVFHTLVLLPSSRELWEEATEFGEFLLARRDFPAQIIEMQLRLTLTAGGLTAADQRRSLDFINQVLAALDSPESHSRHEKDRVRAECEYDRHLLLRLYPDLGFAPETPWKNARKLLHVSDAKDGIVRWFAPRIRDGAVYVVGVGREANGKESYLQLLRCSLEDGRLDRLGRISLGPTPPFYAAKIRSGVMHSQLMMPRFAAVLDQDRYYTAPPDDSGIWVFPTDGGPGHRITTSEQLPAARIDSLACLDGKLYAGLGGGFLIAYDPETSTCTVLASCRRKEKRSPFDDGPPFSIPYLVADPPRHRLVFLVDGDGLWEWNTQTSGFRKILQNGFRAWPRLWETGIHHGRFLLASSFGQFQFNLETDTTEALPRGFPRSSPPVMVADGWLWAASPWGRISPDGKNREFFPPLRRPDTVNDFFYPGECLEPVGDDHQVLVGDQYSLWLLSLPEQLSKDPPPAGVIRE